MTFKIVYTDNVPEDFSIEKKVLSGEDFKIIDAEAATTSTEILLEDADGVISSHQTFDEELLARMTQCKIISRRGIGVDYIDIDAATKHDIIVANVPDYCLTEVANHALALLMTLHRRIVGQNKSVRNEMWRSDAKPIRRLDGQTLGLIAFGGIAQNLAKKAQALNMNIIVSDPYVDNEMVREHGAEPVGFDELLRRSDIVSLHAPLTDETRKMVGMDEIKSMKDTAYLINTARGDLVDQTVLPKALNSGEIAGVGLDVLEQEPPVPSEPLLQQEGAVLTPHMGHYSANSQKELRQKVTGNVRSIIRNRVPENSINPAAHSGLSSVQ